LAEYFESTPATPGGSTLGVGSLTGIQNITAKKLFDKYYGGNMLCLRNNYWKPYVYFVFTTVRPLCHEGLPRALADIKVYPLFEYFGYSVFGSSYVPCDLKHITFSADLI
jgi:hypothetical protein